MMRKTVSALMILALCALSGLGPAALLPAAACPMMAQGIVSANALPKNCCPPEACPCQIRSQVPDPAEAVMGEAGLRPSAERTPLQAVSETVEAAQTAAAPGPVADTSPPGPSEEEKLYDLHSNYRL